MSHKIMKYIWTYPAGILIFLVVGGDLPTWHPFYIFAGLLVVGGLVGYLAEVIYTAIKYKKLEL